MPEEGSVGGAEHITSRHPGGVAVSGERVTARTRESTPVVHGLGALTRVVLWDLHDLAGKDRCSEGQGPVGGHTAPPASPRPHSPNISYFLRGEPLDSGQSLGAQWRLAPRTLRPYVSMRTASCPWKRMASQLTQAPSPCGGGQQPDTLFPVAL